MAGGRSAMALLGLVTKLARFTVALWWLRRQAAQGLDATSRVAYSASARPSGQCVGNWVVRSSMMHFGPFTFEPTTGSLWRGGALLPLLPKDAAVLAVLVQHAGHIVTKEALL